MDLLILFFAVFGGALLLIVILAHLHPGTGADLLDFDPAKRLEQRYAAEFEDMEDMMESHNRRRRARGLPEQTEDEYRLDKQREERSW